MPLLFETITKIVRCHYTECMFIHLRLDLNVTGSDRKLSDSKLVGPDVTTDI
jgi:hypothetical protein